MAVCCCSLAGTAACRTCPNNPNAETLPPVRSNTIIVTDSILATGWKTHADKIRQMSDEELVEAWYYIYDHVIFASTDSRQGLLDWLKQEAISDE